MSGINYVDQDGNYIGNFGDGALPPDGSIEVPSQAPGVYYTWNGSDWVPDMVKIKNDRRKEMKCSRLQGRLVLGKEACNVLDAIAHDPDTPWAMCQAILNAMEWSRNSQSMTEMGYLLGYTDDEMDALFEQAMMVDA